MAVLGGSAGQGLGEGLAALELGSQGELRAGGELMGVAKLNEQGEPLIVEGQLQLRGGGELPLTQDQAEALQDKEALEGVELEVREAQLALLRAQGQDSGQAAVSGGQAAELLHADEQGELVLSADQAAWLRARSSGEAARQEQAGTGERAQVQQVLAELERGGVTGQKLAAALREQLGGAEGPELDGAADGEGAGDSGEGSAALASNALQLISMAEGGAPESLQLGEGDGARFAQNSVGDQIARELRLGGLLSGPLARAAFVGGEAGNGQDGQQGGGGERSPSAEALAEALQGGGGSEEGGTSRDFGSLLATAQGGGGGLRGGTWPLSVQQPVGHSGFASGVGERVAWMVTEGVQQARLQLNPPGMGSLDIDVQVGDERTTVNITAHSAATREALENDMERLKQMLGEQGQGAVDVNVSQGGDEDGEAPATEAPVAAGAGEEAEPDGGGDEQEPAGDRGLIDHYA